MATAKKLPSGSWRCRAYAGTDASGKKIIMSFTAPTKREAELKAAQYVAGNRHSKSDLTVREAVDRYITAKTAVLSASTIHGYRGLQRRYYDSIGSRRLYTLTAEDMQLFISDLSLKVSAKTVANAYGLLSSSVSMFRPDAVFRVTLPTKKVKRRESPSDEDVRTLFEAAEPELKISIALSAYGSLRRGEICALKYSDISGNMISVHADMVINERESFEYKDYPKTSDSVRAALVPSEVVALIGDGSPDDFIIKATPDQITSRFIYLRDKLGLRHIRFHDLRHYYASIGAALGIPDTYLSQFGGWRPSSGVMKSVYQNSIADMSAGFAQRMSDHFSSQLVSTFVSTKTENSGI